MIRFSSEQQQLPNNTAKMSLTFLDNQELHRYQRTDAHVFETPKEMYRSVWFEALGLVVSGLQERVSSNSGCYCVDCDGGSTQVGMVK